MCAEHTFPRGTQLLASDIHLLDYLMYPPATSMKTVACFVQYGFPSSWALCNFFLRAQYLTDGLVHAWQGFYF